MARRPVLERFLSKFVRGADNECWPWTAAMRNGYGAFGIREGLVVDAHRASLMLLRGMVLPSGRSMHVDHLCRNKRCVNPRHLEVVTSQENHLRSRLARWGQPEAPQCSKGHELSGDNVVMSSVGRYGKRFRSCRICRCARLRASSRARAARQQALIRDLGDLAEEIA
jgi:hypothetical protein